MGIKRKVLMGLWAAIAAVGLSMAAVPASAFSVGDRVFIPMYSENLLNDGYADGLITAMNSDGTVSIRLSDVVNGKDKTLAGTCSPRPGVDIMQPTELAKRRSAARISGRLRSRSAGMPLRATARATGCLAPF